jgi:hypothetical protein
MSAGTARKFVVDLAVARYSDVQVSAGYVYAGHIYSPWLKGAVF